MFEISSACQRLMRIYRLSELDVRSICVELDRESPVSIGHGVAFTVTEKALGRRRFLAIVDHATDQGASVLRVVFACPTRFRRTELRSRRWPRSFRREINGAQRT